MDKEYVGDVHRLRMFHMEGARAEDGIPGDASARRRYDAC